MREELPFPDKVLQTLHNLCATAADLARRGEEVARILQRDQNEMREKSGIISMQEELSRSVLYLRSEK
jgi:hypothetical protein